VVFSSRHTEIAAPLFRTCTGALSVLYGIILYTNTTTRAHFPSWLPRMYSTSAKQQSQVPRRGSDAIAANRSASSSSEVFPPPTSEAAPAGRPPKRQAASSPRLQAILRALAFPPPRRVAVDGEASRWHYQPSLRQPDGPPRFLSSSVCRGRLLADEPRTPRTPPHYSFPSLAVRIVREVADGHTSVSFSYG